MVFNSLVTCSGIYFKLEGKSRVNESGKSQNKVKKGSGIFLYKNHHQYLFVAIVSSIREKKHSLVSFLNYLSCSKTTSFQKQKKVSRRGKSNGKIRKIRGGCKKNKS
jgi:hypothetical protein